MNLSASDLKKYSYFSSLSDQSLDILANKITLVHFPAGSEVVREGTIGNSFYFVKEGELEVTKKGKSGEEDKISVINSGQGFGEMALLTCSVRSSSVRAITSAALYELPKPDFEDIVLQESAFKNRLLDRVKGYNQYNKIRSLQPFELLPSAKMAALMEKLTEKHYSPGENIIVQGEKGDYYYIIKSGQVVVLKKKSGEGGYTRVALLGSGEAFGEEALIRDDPRNATCQAIEETTVFVLDRRDFNMIMKKSFIENIFPEDISTGTYLDEFVLIDARVPAEYHEEHISGALNIPIEILREQCTRFDRSRKYITYCLNDSRGMVGAFLLKNRGFDAQCLRGGVSAWTGPTVVESDGIYFPSSPPDS